MNVHLWLKTLCLTMALAAPTLAYDFNTVMVGGRPAGDPLGPEIAGITDFNFARDWYINNQGQVSFHAFLDASAASTENQGIWLWKNGQKELLLRNGFQAPGLDAGTLISGFGEQAYDLANDGGVLANVILTGTNVTSANDASTFYVGPGSTTATPVREGDVVSDINALTTFDRPRQFDYHHNLYPAGELVGRFDFTGPGVTSDNDQGVFAGTPADLQLYAREGSQIPGQPAGTHYGQFSETFASNDQFVFVSNIENPDLSKTRTLFLASAGHQPSILAKFGEPNGFGGTFGLLTSPTINSSGTVAFVSDDDDLFKVVNGTPELIAGGNLQAPGTGAGYGGLNGFPYILSETGDIAFAHTIDTPDAATDEGIWIHDSQGTRLALREGAPTGVPGVSLGSLLGRGTGFAFNDQQHLVGVADLVGAVTSDSDSALWHLAPDGGINLLVRTGQEFDVDPTAAVDMRTVSSISLSGIENGSDGGSAKLGVLNDHNMMTFALSFTDGTSGIFTAQVPEPSTIAIAALAGVTLIGLACRRR